MYIIFNCLEKIYERIPREVMWWILEQKGRLSNYIDVIKETKDNVVLVLELLTMQTANVGLHQGSTLIECFQRGKEIGKETR